MVQIATWTIWWEEKVALVGDTIFHAIYIKSLEQHCQRFLWRNLQQHQSPDANVMERVKLCDTPGPAISTEAVYKTDDLFRENCPRAGDLLKKSSYVDDLINSFLVRLMRWTPLKKWRTYSPKEDSQSNVDSSLEKQELASTNCETANMLPMRVQRSQTRLGDIERI